MERTQSPTHDNGGSVKPLEGVTVIEVGGIGPAPFGGMVLAGMGARVHRIERPGATDPPRNNALLRGREMHAIDLKQPAGVEKALELIGHADAVYEGFRPGTMERLGLDPDECFAANPQLIYARMTGWGQDGPYASKPGHDINYLAVSGVLNTIGEAGGRPLAPVNYVADYGSGGMMLAAGLLAGLVRRHVSGRGAIIDVAMVDGSGMLLADLGSRLAAGDWIPKRGMNGYDGGSHFYRTYRTQDGRYMAVGAVEAKFYTELLQVLGLTDVDSSCQYDRATWAEMSTRIASIFARHTQEHWISVFDAHSACVSPVLEWDQLTSDPHLHARASFTQVNGAVVPAAAPRFRDARPVGSAIDVGDATVPNSLVEPE